MKIAGLIRPAIKADEVLQDSPKAKLSSRPAEDLGQGFRWFAMTI